MPALALILYVVFMLLAFGWRSIRQYRRTGSTGFVGVNGKPGSLEHIGGVLFVVALLLGLAAPILQLGGVVDPVVEGTEVEVVGAVLAAAGIAATLAAQTAMGDSWRIGVDADTTTTLVTSGPFALVRNPIFAAMLPTSAGLTLLAANPVALVGLVALVAALEIQTRAVEEPYLLATHGDTYARYAARTGRFLPGVGRVKSDYQT